MDKEKRVQTDWINFDIGKAWQNSDDKKELALEIITAFQYLQKIFWEVKPNKYRYYDVIITWFHDGNRDCGHLKSLMYLGREISWVVFYRLFNYLQWSYAIMELSDFI